MRDFRRVRTVWVVSIMAMTSAMAQMVTVTLPPIDEDDELANSKTNVSWTSDVGDEAELMGAQISYDHDGDGLLNAEEVAIGTDPDDADTDKDGLWDVTEVLYGFDPLNPRSLDSGKTDADVDADDDGWSNVMEQDAGTDMLDIEEFPGSPTRKREHADGSYILRVVRP